MKLPRGIIRLTFIVGNLLTGVAEFVFAASMNVPIATKLPLMGMGWINVGVALIIWQIFTRSD